MCNNNPLTICASRQSVLWFTLLLFFFSPCLISAQSITKEYQAKSVFLLNFSKFVTWPDSCFRDLQSPFIIGIVGDDPFGNYLDETVAGEKVVDHPMTVKRFKTGQEIGDCHILFINYKDSSLVQEIIALVKKRNILTVSDTSNFTSMGGMIAFNTAGDAIRFDINAAAAKDADLVISSKLLRLAEVENK